MILSSVFVELLMVLYNDLEQYSVILTRSFRTKFCYYLYL